MLYPERKYFRPLTVFLLQCGSIVGITDLCPFVRFLRDRVPVRPFSKNSRAFTSGGLLSTQPFVHLKKFSSVMGTLTRGGLYAMCNLITRLPGKTLEELNSQASAANLIDKQPTENVSRNSPLHATNMPPHALTACTSM